MEEATRQANGSVLSGWTDGFPQSGSSAVGFSNTNSTGFTERGEAIDGNQDDDKDRHVVIEQWVDFNLEEKETGTQPSSRVKNSITWIVLILFIIQIVGLVTTIFVFTKAKPHLPPPPAAAAAAATSCCPPGWHLSQGNCYHVLNTGGSWNASQNLCSSLGASLAVFGDLEKLTGATNVKEPYNHWIGLRRSSEDSWKWPDGTAFNNLFEVEGDGRCAYLKDGAVSSADCAISKTGLCSLKGLMNHEHCRAT